MKKALLFALACAGATSASAFRDDFVADPLEAIEHACATDPSRVVAAIARALDVPVVQVHRGMGRYTLANPEGGHVCARDETERRKIVAASRQLKKVRNETGKQFLLDSLKGPDGKIDHAAVSRAFDQREDMLIEAGEKRSGLPPAAPVGWTNLTGYSQSPGRVNHLLFTSGTGNDILAAADGGGIWRSTNGGASWTFVNDFFGSLAIGNFAKADNNANVIYAATNPSGSHTYFPFGVLKSTDGGVTWNQLASTSPGTNGDFTYIQRIAVHPANADIVLAATTAGAYESVNGGASWTKIGGIATRSNFVAFHPTDGNRRAVTYHDGTVRYTTTGDLHGAGATTATVVTNGQYMKIAYARSDVNRMYALLTDASVTKLFMSTTGGSTWTQRPGPGSPAGSDFYNGTYLSYTGGLWVDPLNANRVGVFEGWAYFTPDITAVTPTYKGLASGWVDFHSWVEHPGYDGATNTTVFLSDDGGIYKATTVDTLDQFAGFSRIETGLAVTQVYSVSGHRGNPIFGAQDIGPKAYTTASGDATNKWRFLTRTMDDPQGYGGYSWISDGMTTAASTSNPSVLYGSLQFLQMFRSNDGGQTARNIVYGTALADGRGATTPNYDAAFLAPFVLDPSNQSRMWAGGVSLWRSENVDTGNPPTWTQIRGPFADPSCGGVYTPPINTLAVAPSNPDVVWISYQCSGKVFKSTNATQASPTFTQVTTLPPAASNFKASITFDRYNPDIVWIGVSNYQANTLFKTTDGGATTGNWTAVPGLPGAPVYSLLQHPAATQWMYAATGVGLFASNNGGATWSASNEGPANVVARTLDWNTTGTVSELLLGTYGRGVWKATVQLANADLNGDTKSDIVYRNSASGQVYRLSMNGLGIASRGMVYTETNTSWRIIGEADFNADGVSDLLWRNISTGQVYVQPFGSNGLPSGGAIVHTEPNLSWRVIATPDFNGDGRSDILWRNHSTGQVYAMIMNGTSITAQGMVYVESNLSWSIVATGDFAGSGKRNQLLWRNSSSGLVYLMTVSYNGTSFSQTGQMIYSEPSANWQILGAPDLNGDGRSDVLWRNSATGQVYAMLMNGGSILSAGMVYAETDLQWRVIAFADYNGDGKADILYRNISTGQVFMMLMNGLAVSSSGMVYNEPNTSWRIVGPPEYQDT